MLPVGLPVPDPRRKVLPIPDPTRGYIRTRSLPVRLPYNKRYSLWLGVGRRMSLILM